MFHYKPYFNLCYVKWDVLLQDLVLTPSITIFFFCSFSFICEIKEKVFV